MTTFGCAIFIPTTLGHPWGYLIHAPQLYHLRLTPTILTPPPPAPSPNHLPYPPPATDSITHSPINLFLFIPVMHEPMYMSTTYIPTLHTHHAHHHSYFHLPYPPNLSPHSHLQLHSHRPNLLPATHVHGNAFVLHISVEEGGNRLLPWSSSSSSSDISMHGCTGYGTLNGYGGGGVEEDEKVKSAL